MSFINLRTGDILAGFGTPPIKTNNRAIKEGGEGIAGLPSKLMENLFSVFSWPINLEIKSANDLQMIGADWLYSSGSKYSNK